MSEELVLKELGQAGLEIRRKCIDDPLYLGQHILGYDYSSPAQFHRDVAQAMRDNAEYLCLAPRGHGKTILCDIVGIVWEIIRNPDVRILLCHGKLDSAQKILRLATNAFRENKKLRALFPEFCPQSKDEDPTLLQFITPARTKDMFEPTVMAAAPGSTVTGFHFDIIKATDIVNEQNVPAPIGLGSEESMQKVVEFIKTFTPLLDKTNPNARRQFDGTRWDDRDAYGYVLENYPKIRKIIYGIEEDEHGEPVPIWEKMGVEPLRDARQEAGEVLWAANYRNNPLAGVNALFKREWFKFVDNDEIPARDKLRVAITIDPAIEQNTINDCTAMVVSGVEEESGNLYVLAVRNARMSPDTFFEELFALDDMWNPDYIGVEQVAFQKLLIWWADDIARREGKRLPLKPLKPDGNKVRRANQIRLHAERYGIYVRPGMNDLVEQFLRFPVGKHDDMVDALAYRGQDLLLPGRFNRENVRERITKVDCTSYHQIPADLIQNIENPSKRRKFNIRRF